MPTSNKLPTRINTILETADEGFWLVDNDEVTLDINPAMCTILGYSKSEMIGKNVSKFLDLDNRKIFNRESKIRASGKKSSYEITFLRKDGNEVPCIVHGSPYFDEQGQLIGSFAMVTDISDHKTTENALRRSERKYRILFQNSPSGILFVDLKGNIRDLNPTLVEIFGAPSLNAVKEINLFKDKGLVDSGISWAFKNCIISGKAASYEHAYTTKWGKEVFLKYRLNPIWRENGFVEGVLANILDFTENLASEKRLRSTHEVYRSAILNAQGVPYRLNFRSGIYEFFSEGYEKLLGIPPTSDLSIRQLEKMTQETIITDPHQRMNPQEYTSAFLDGKIERFRVDIKIETHTGAVKWLSNSCVPLRDESSGQVIGALGIMQDISDRKHIEMELKDREELYRTLYESSSDAICLLKNDVFIECNPKSLEIFGCRRNQLVNTSIFRFSTETQPDGQNSVEKAHVKLRAAYAGQNQFFEWRYQKFDGTIFFAEVNLKHITLQDEPFLLAVIRDITQRRKMESHVQQSQKMEAVGQLAGGIAHDFNNMLTVIRGYSDLILNHPVEPEVLRKRIKQIDRACQRAEGLTHQLLAFSRRQILKPQIFNLNDFIKQSDQMLRHMVGENIELIVKLAPDLAHTKADPDQIELVIMNLVINARDALPGGGKIIIETSNASIDQNTMRQHPEARSGKYVLLAISDNGQGMDRETQSHIFEPFYTTKKDLKGSGLGLSTAYGIIKQSDGFIWVYSEPNYGSTFRIYLPWAKEEPKPDNGAAKSESSLRGQETILLVEDEEDVRMLVKETLQMMDYYVIEAANGQEALDIFNQNNQSIELVLTDVVMPKMGGPEFVKKLLAEHPDTKVIFMSGYTEDAIVHKGVLEPGTQFIQKPFMPVTLMQKVREVLDNS